MTRKIDKRACRKFAIPELEFNLNEGILHVERCPYIIRTAVHNISGQRSLHYPDYDFHGNLSILQGHKKDPVLPIGAAALCVCCGNELWSNGDIKCSCKEVVVCRKCGQTVARGQGIYLEDGFYCKTCLHICEACGRPTLGTMYPAYDRRGSLLQICHDCYQQLTASCTSCSMAAACRTMGFTICKKATIPVVA